MIDLFLAHAKGPAAEPDLLRAIEAHAKAVFASARATDGGIVAKAEAAVIADPGAFTFDAAGAATLTAAGHTWHAGRFEPVAIGTLRERVAAARAAGASGKSARLWVFDGVSPATDIGSLQATAGQGTLFQVASQFNCLEAPGPRLVPVKWYVTDPTQGPRASVSAFPATLLRHYAAPGPDGKRFTQVDGAPQIDLLADVCDPAVARVQNGYLGAAVTDPKALVSALETRFDAIRVGVHDAAQVVLGYNWYGAVEGSAQRRIGQVFTSTVAGGVYGGAALGPHVFEATCQTLLRAAYLGTLLAAASLGRDRVVLTLIGGGVFGNPIELIWDSIQWALDQAQPLLSRDLDVIVNGREIGARLDHEAILAPVRARGGVMLSFDHSGTPTLHR